MRAYEQVFEIDAGAALPRRVVVEIEREARRLPVPFGDDALKFHVGAKTVAEQVGLAGDRRLWSTLVFRQIMDEVQDQARVLRSGRPNGKHKFIIGKFVIRGSIGDLVICDWYRKNRALPRR